MLGYFTVSGQWSPYI